MALPIDPESPSRSELQIRLWEEEAKLRKTEQELTKAEGESRLGLTREAETIRNEIASLKGQLGR
jgi:hypothetical protein